MRWGQVIVTVLPAVVLADVEVEGDSADGVEFDWEQDSKTKHVQYQKISAPDAVFVERFDEGWEDRWVLSELEKFNGRWGNSFRQEELIIGDKGLEVLDKARHHGISARIPAIGGDQGFVMQYEVKFQNGHECGGAYLKAFKAPEEGLGVFSGDTPYVIMFGPDQCGHISQVHFILNHQNPTNQKWTEHSVVHMVKPPVEAPDGPRTHLYTLHIMNDGEYEIYIDQESQGKYSMLDDMKPSFTPPKKIDDPEDTKPSDWIDEKYTDDPEDFKPEDWDDNAPRMIDDPERLEPPADWLLDEEYRIPDPDASEPQDWDEEEDGEWEAPMVNNPECEDASGCGAYTIPQINNPKFRGKWAAKKIDNPEYIGEWSPRKIANPYYFADAKPHNLPTMDALGFELWTMNDGVLFDNILISRNLATAQQYAKETWKLRANLEELKAAENSLADKLPWYYQKWFLTTLVIGLTTIGVLIVLFGSFDGKDAGERTRATEQQVTAGENAEADVADDQNGGEDADGAEQDEGDSGEAKAEETEEKCEEYKTKAGKAAPKKRNKRVD